MGSFASFLLFQRDADPVKAVFWAMKAAEAGNAEGQVLTELSIEDTKYYVSLFLPHSAALSLGLSLRTRRTQIGCSGSSVLVRAC